jgi:hypothetical protein
MRHGKLQGRLLRSCVRRKTSTAKKACRFGVSPKIASVENAIVSTFRIRVGLQPHDKSRKYRGFSPGPFLSMNRFLDQEVVRCWVRRVSCVCGGESVAARFSHEPGTDRVLMNVARMDDVVVDVRDATAVVAAFPYVELAPETKRETSFDVLHSLFQGDIWSRS